MTEEEIQNRMNSLMIEDDADEYEEDDRQAPQQETLQPEVIAEKQPEVQTERKSERHEIAVSEIVPYGLIKQLGTDKPDPALAWHYENLCASILASLDNIPYMEDDDKKVHARDILKSRIISDRQNENIMRNIYASYDNAHPEKKPEKKVSQTETKKPLGDSGILEEALPCPKCGNTKLTWCGNDGSGFYQCGVCGTSDSDLYIDDRLIMQYEQITIPGIIQSAQQKAMHGWNEYVKRQTEE